VWDVSCAKDEGLIGGATILLFNSKKQLRTGKQKLRLWLGKEADGSFPSSTPGKVSVKILCFRWFFHERVFKFRIDSYFSSL